MAQEEKKKQKKSDSQRGTALIHDLEDQRGCWLAGWLAGWLEPTWLSLSLCLSLASSFHPLVCLLLLLALPKADQP